MATRSLSPVEGRPTQPSLISEPERSSLPQATLKAAAGAQAALAPAQQLSTQPSARVQEILTGLIHLTLDERCELAEALKPSPAVSHQTECKSVPLSIHNALCVLQDHALPLFDLLAQTFSDKQCVKWTTLYAESMESEEVEAFLELNPTYIEFSPKMVAEIVSLKKKLEQFEGPSQGLGLYAHNLWARLSDLQIGVNAIVRSDFDANQLKRELSQAKLSSVCLFALSIPPSAECYWYVRTIIENKLEEANLQLKTENLWTLCQELRPTMQKEALERKMEQVAFRLSHADQKYKILSSCLSANEFLPLEQALDKDQSPENRENIEQIKGILPLVRQMAQMDPCIIQGRFRLFGSFTNILCFALVLTQVGAKGAHYHKWCEQLKTHLCVQSLSLTELEECFTKSR